MIRGTKHQVASREPGTVLALAAVALVGLMTSCSQVRAALSVEVYDGDTLTIDSVKWRLWGVDAPEHDQKCSELWNGEHATVQCGLRSRDNLRALVRGKRLTCERRGRSHDRIVGRCWADGVDLSAAQVEAGWALDYHRYSHGEYADEEAEARAAVRGIWASDFETPERWRRTHR